MISELKLLITDTSIWIDLIKRGLLDAFFELPFSIYAVDFVRDNEVIGVNWSTLAEKGLQLIELSPSEILDLYNLKQAQPCTSLPDIASYVAAIKINGILLTGDKALRSFAEERLEVHGLLWVIDLFVHYQILTPEDASICLELMLRDPNTRLPKDECTKRINKWRS